MIDNDKIKWHELKMKCAKEGCPNIDVSASRVLSDVLKDVCNITCNAHVPVITNFHGGL